MLRPIDNFFLQYGEPVNSCLQFLRNYILQHDAHIGETWQYGMPFYRYRQKRLCYLWYHQKFKQPYIGIVDGSLVSHPALLTEKRAKMKILLVDPGEDLPLQTIDDILKILLAAYR